MENEYMLTTFDNPFNPFKDFVSWFMYDTEQGYNTCARLARITSLNDEMSEEEVNEAIDKAMEEIIYYDFMHIYTRINKDTNVNVNLKTE